MKKQIVGLILAFAAVSNLHARCGGCGAGANADHDYAKKGSCSGAQLESYFQTQVALANDDLATARAGAKAMLAAVESMSCSAKSANCCSQELAGVQAIAKAEDISAARLAFKDWSDGLVAKMEKGGSHAQAVYKMRCPMAFDNTGAAWLQSSKDLRNPYFGASMLTCGMLASTYEAGEKTACCCTQGECKDCVSCEDCDKCEKSGAKA